MNRMKRLMSLLLAVLMLFAVAAQLVACDDPVVDPNNPDDGGNTNDGEKSTYTVSVKSAGGYTLTGITAYIYDTDGDIKGFSKLDDKGTATFTLPVSSDYEVMLDGVPEGYLVNERYPLGTTGANIVLSSQIIADQSIVGVSYKLGDIMRDFSLTDTDGNIVKLSEVLKTKKAVLLNFWFINCGYCVEEFPGLNEAYAKYGDDIEIIAINTQYDAPEDIKAFKESFGSHLVNTTGYENNLDFIMVSDTSEVSGVNMDYTLATPQPIPGIHGAFGYNQAPVSVMIDRYGMVSLTHMGALSQSQFEFIFEHYSAPDYKQTVYQTITDLVPKEKPNVNMPSSEEMGAVINSGDIKVTYTPELNAADAEYSWPFVIVEKNNEKVIMPANGDKKVHASFATLHANIEMNKGDAFIFDYYSLGTDNMVVLVDGRDIYQISGVESGWKECCPWVAPADGVYDVAFVYVKDTDDVIPSNQGGGEYGDIYLKNFRIASVEDITTETYIPRDAATNPNASNTDFQNYVDIVYNEEDGYYHVGTVDGPILLAKLLYNTKFSEESVIEKLNANHETKGFMIGDENYYKTFVKYCGYASHSKIHAYCSVTKELKMLLEAYVDMYSFAAPHENTWLQLCAYYDSYGYDDEGNAYPQLEDITAGLSAHSAYKAELGDNNTVEYSGIGLLPRGYLYEFIPDKSGVYRVTTLNAKQEVVGWIFIGNDKIWIEDDRILYTTADEGERYCDELIKQDNDGNYYFDTKNGSMVAYMEAGTPYYIDFAFYDMYGAGSFNFEITYVGETYDYFVVASPGFFTFELLPGDKQGDTIAGGIKTVLGDDGYYYHLKEDGTKGSLVYADFYMTTSIFTTISLKEMIEKRPDAFDFTYSQDDIFVMDFLEKYGRDKVKFEEMYGENAWERYKVNDVINGVYHGVGGIMHEEFKEYLEKANTDETNHDLYGCVAVDERLAELLQMLMDTYTFEDCKDPSWTKLCYYYNYLGYNGPEAE